MPDHLLRPQFLSQNFETKLLVKRKKIKKTFAIAIFQSFVFFRCVGGTYN